MELRLHVARLSEIVSGVRIDQVCTSLNSRKIEPYLRFSVITNDGVHVMDQSRAQLEQKAAKARLLAGKIADKQAAEAILALARELEEQAKRQTE